MSIAPRILDGQKHCFVPCPPDQCDCGRGHATIFLTDAERREMREERRKSDVNAALALGDEAKALELSLEE